MPTVEEIRKVARDSLVGMFEDIDRLTMLSVSDWTERDMILAQAALCYTSSMLIGEAYGKPTKDGQPVE